MMVTARSNIFACTLAQATTIAEMAGLRKLVGKGRYDEFDARWDTYHAWEDRKYGGAGCRITWKNGVAWVSRHSGNEAWDMTEEVCYFFREVYGLKEVDDRVWLANPRIYGERQSDQWFEKHPHYIDGGD